MNTFLKTYESKVPNSNISLKKPIAVKDLLCELKNPDCLRNALKLQQFSILYFWDFGIRASQYLVPGDKTIISMQDYIYIGQIRVIINDPTGELGDNIGWIRQYQRPWKNVVAYTKIACKEATAGTISGIKEIRQNSEMLTNNFFRIPDDLDWQEILSA